MSGRLVEAGARQVGTRAGVEGTARNQRQMMSATMSVVTEGTEGNTRTRKMVTTRTRSLALKMIWNSPRTGLDQCLPMKVVGRAIGPAGESVTRKSAVIEREIAIVTATVTATGIGIGITSPAGAHTVTETMNAGTGMATGIGIKIENAIRTRAVIGRSAITTATEIGNTATEAARSRPTSHPRRWSPPIRI